MHLAILWGHDGSFDVMQLTMRLDIVQVPVIKPIAVEMAQILTRQDELQDHRRRDDSRLDRRRFRWVGRMCGSHDISHYVEDRQEPVDSYDDQRWVIEGPTALSPAAKRSVSDACTLEEWDQAVQQLLVQERLTEKCDG